jgi:4-amino-4-deoxy-L-arabinose transferase-like glycosyltransferase
MLFSSRHAPNRALTAVQLACVALSVALVALMLVSAASRIPFPFELEWMEGATLVHVQRLIDGRPLYVRPSLEFVPFAYPPLYYVVCVPFAWVFGPGFVALRVVSLLSTCAALAAVFVLVRRHAGNVAATIAGGTLAGAYALSDAWLDLGRVDALYLALMAATWCVISTARTPRQWITAGLLAWLAFLTKQPALLSLAPLGVYLLMTDRRAAMWFGVPTAVLCAASVAWLAWVTDGWYAYYVFELPRLRMKLSLDVARTLSFFTSDLLRPLPMAVLFGTLGAVAVRRSRDVAIAAGLTATAWLARLEGGAWNNAVLPAYLAAAVVFGLSLQRLGRWLLPILALAALQLGWLLYDPRPFMPTADDRAAGARLVDVLRTRPQPVFVLDHNSWATLAGQREFAHGWAVTDVVWADRTKAGPALETEIRRALEAEAFATIVLDDGRSWFRKDVERHYRPVGPVFDSVPPYRMRSGAARRPASLFEPRR